MRSFLSVPAMATVSPALAWVLSGYFALIFTRPSRSSRSSGGLAPSALRGLLDATPAAVGCFDDDD